MAYLTTNDEKILDGFKKHGFSYEYNIDFLNSNIIKKRNGAVSSLEKMVQDEEIMEDENIKLYSLLSLIPALQNIYNKTTNYVFNIANDIDSNYKFKIITEGKEFDRENFNKAIDILKFNCDYVTGNVFQKKGIIIYLSVVTKENINKLKGLPYICNKHIFMPILIGNKAFLIQPMVASYLIIMYYSMLVRYHAEKWDKIIDSKISKSYSLVKMSVESCLNEFIINLYRYIFKQLLVNKY